MPLVKLPPKIQLLLTKFQANIGLRRALLALLIVLMPGGLLIGALIAAGILKKKRDLRRASEASKKDQANEQDPEQDHQ